MDWNYMGKLLLSVLLFAPGVFVLGLALFVGFLMVLERWGVFGRPQRAVEGAVADAGATNPMPGQIVAEFKGLVETDQKGEAQTPDKVANGSAPK